MFIGAIPVSQIKMVSNRVYSVVGTLDYDDGHERVLTIEGTYNSSLGTGLPFKDQLRFNVKDLIAVS